MHRGTIITICSGVIDYLPTAKLFLKLDFDRNKLASLIANFRPAVKRGCDLRLADQLEADLLTIDGPRFRTPTIRRLAKWCKTDGIYADGMEIAKEISLLLFGQVVDPTRLGI